MTTKLTGTTYGYDIAVGCLFSAFVPEDEIIYLTGNGADGSRTKGGTTTELTAEEDRLARARALDRASVNDAENEPPDFEVDDGFEI